LLKRNCQIELVEAAFKTEIKTDLTLDAINSKEVCKAEVVEAVVKIKIALFLRYNFCKKILSG